MDLIISYKSRFRLWIVWIFLIIILFSTFAHAWRITPKCPHGHYFSDGCTACWCDIQTGHTKCEKLSQCPRVTNHVKCPHGRQYKDRCGNDCTCYERTGAVLCNEKIKCPHKMPETIHTPPPSSHINDNTLLRRGGMWASRLPPIEEQPVRLRLPDTTPFPPRRVSPSTTTTRNGNDEFYFQNVAIASTPHPHVRIPSREQSEELIIEPAIIVRKKGSNKASIVRNPSSATSVTLPSSRRRHHDLIFGRSDDRKADSTRSMGPIQLYEKQLQTIMNIRRAYSQLLNSKVNFNFQIATGKVPKASTVGSIQSTTDHPRRFDSEYDKSNILVSTTPSPQIFMTSQQPKPPPAPPDIQVKTYQPMVWRKEIKHVLKQFSPVPPLKHLVSYVTSSTENYLRDFLNRNRLHQQESVQIVPSPPETTTLAPPPPLPTMMPITTPGPTPFISYPSQSFSTIEPFHDHQNDPSTVPIHEIYRKHDFKVLTSPNGPQSIGHNAYLHKTLGNPSSQYNSIDYAKVDPKKEQFPHMHDLMREIIRMDTLPSTTAKSTPTLTALPTFQTPGPPYAEIEEVRPLSFLPPPQPEPATPTRRTFSSGQSEKPAFPLNVYRKYPKEEVDEGLHPRPTVRVNLDKPIYISPPNTPNHQQPQFPPYQQQPQIPHYQQQTPQFPPQFQFPPFQQQSPQQPTYLQHQHPPNQQQSPPHQPRFPLPPHPFPPPHHNRRIYSIPPSRTHSFAPPPFQQSFHLPPQIQRHHTNTNQQLANHHRPLFSQFFMPKPKQYRLVLKGAVRDAAVRVDDVVPRFVNKIAHEFFKKPEIYVPKIRPGKPLTLEKVVLNHREIVPTEMSFSPITGVPPTKLRFTPQAQWEMKEELAKQGIMLDEPLHTPIRDYAANDPNVMEMDAPVKAVQTWEAHSSMGVNTYPDYSTGTVPEVIQQESSQLQQHQQQMYGPILFPSPAPTQIPLPTLDHQHQQEIQHQILLAQNQYRNQPTLTSSDGVFKIDTGDLNDFKLDDLAGQDLPKELQIPGVDQVVVDKYLVHDPMDPSGALKMYTTTTIQPSTAKPNLDLASMLTQHHRNGLAALPAHGPTPPPAVLVRHHGAPTPKAPTVPLPTPVPPQVTSYSSENVLVTLINSSPQPFVSTTISPIENAPSLQISDTRSGIIDQPAASDSTSSLVSQIHDFLAEEMDFGARPELNLYDMLFQHRTGEVAAADGGTRNDNEPLNEEQHFGAAAQNAGDEHQRDEIDDQIATETKSSIEDGNIDTEKVANIFSIDYKNKYNKKPPAVIVIKVPPDHSDGPFPKVIEKRRGEEIEIRGGYQSSTNQSKEAVRLSGHKHELEEASTEKTVTSTKGSMSSSESSDDDGESDFSKESLSSARKRRRKNRKRKRRRRKKNRNRTDEDDRNKEMDSKKHEEDNEDSNANSSKTNSKSSGESKSEHGKKEQEKRLLLENTTPQIQNETVAGAEEKFQAELDWKSQLMANICEINPSSPLCLTYRSICLLMTSDESQR